MQQSHVILGLEQQFEEAFSQESQRGISSLIEEINNHLDQNDQLTSYSTESRKSSGNNIVKKNYIPIKRDKEKQVKFYEVVFEYFGATKEKIKYNYGKSKNYISKKEIAWPTTRYGIRYRKNQTGSCTLSLRNSTAKCSTIISAAAIRIRRSIFFCFFVIWVSLHCGKSGLLHLRQSRVIMC